MPPLRKPAAQRARTNTPEVGELTDETPDTAPRPPAGLLKQDREDWVTFWADPVAQRVRVTDQPRLRRLFILRSKLTRLERVVAKEPFVAGSKGQPTVNPAERLIGTLRRDIDALERSFGIGGEESRFRLGMTFGEAGPRTLADLNAAFDAEEDDDDPRLHLVS